MKTVPYLRGDTPAEGDRSEDNAGLLEPSDDPARGQRLECVRITVRVPSDRVESMQRCALLIRRSGEETFALEEIVSPVSSMTIDEAETVRREMLSDDPLQGPVPACADPFQIAAVIGPEGARRLIFRF